jgi:hypothetical protein
MDSSTEKNKSAHLPAAGRLIKNERIGFTLKERELFIAKSKRF